MTKNKDCLSLLRVLLTRLYNMARNFKITFNIFVFILTIPKCVLSQDAPCITINGADGECMRLSECRIFGPTSTNRFSLSEIIARHQKSQPCRIGEICCATRTLQTIPVLPKDDVKNTSQSLTPRMLSWMEGVSTPQPIPVGLTDSRLTRLPIKTCGFSVINFIIDGQRAESGQFPWMAMLCAGFGNIQGQCTCSATVIARRYVLTAASCIAFLPAGAPRPSMVVMGDVDSRTQTATLAQRYAIQRYIAHPNFNPRNNQQNDIAILWLNRDIDFNKGLIRPVCLPLGKIQFKNLDTTSDLTVAGWGTADRNPNLLSAMSQFLQYTTVRTVSNNRCGMMYSKTAVITPSMICAGQANEGACKGDLGGPLTMLDYVNDTENLRAVQVGVNSWNPTPCGTPSTPGVYTRVGYFIDWILDNIP